MTPRPASSSRWTHFKAWITRQARGHRKDTIAIVVLALAGIVMMLAIFTQQKASLPSWLPFVGEEFEHISADFTTAQAVTPGQGQAVDIAGIQIGKVASVDLEDGHAVVGMEIEPKYMELIHPNATLLLRPKTNLNDMVVEISPGSGKTQVEDGTHFTLAQTEPNTNLDAFLGTLDADTRQYLQLLVSGGAEGIGGRGRQLGNAFRRFQPFVHYTAKLNRAVAQRHEALARVIHDFGLLTTELGQHDADIRRFVSASDASLGNFANQQQAIQESLQEFPSTLRAARAGLASSNRFSTAAYPALTKLIPQAQASTPAFRALEGLFKQTTTPLRNPDPAFHSRNSTRPGSRQRRFGATRQDGHEFRQRARRSQRLLQRAGLQAERQEAELPLLPPLAEPRLQRGVRPSGRWRTTAARHEPHQLPGFVARVRNHRDRAAVPPHRLAGSECASRRNPAQPSRPQWEM